MCAGDRGIIARETLIFRGSLNLIDIVNAPTSFGTSNQL